MNMHKKLLEAKPIDKEVQDFIAQNQYHPFVKRWMVNFKEAAENGTLKEAIGAAGAEPEIGALVGQTIGDAAAASTRSVSDMQVYATLEIFNAVIRGFTRYMDDSFVRKYVTEKVVFKVPLVEYQELAANIATAEFPHTEKTIDYATVDLSTPESEKGAKITWTRAFLEDVTFDAQAEMMEGLGHAIAKMMMTNILQLLMDYGTDTTADITAYKAALAHGDVRTISNPITWAQFLATVGDVDIGISDVTDTDWPTTRTYGPADYVLVSTDVYWQLLNIIQLTNVLYEGSTDPINSGKIKLALGCTIVKQSLLPAGTIIALNSEKAIALVTRRMLKIEPVLFPVWNEYGFIGSVRFGTTILFPGAIAIGNLSGTLPEYGD